MFYNFFGINRFNLKNEMLLEIEQCATKFGRVILKGNTDF